MTRPSLPRVLPDRPTFLYSRANVAQTVAAKNYLTLVNPVSSGKLFVVGAVFLSSTNTVGNSTLTEPIRGHRITGASGGVAVPAANVVKLLSVQPTHVGELQDDATTVTGLGAGFFNVPVAIDNRSSNVQDVALPEGAPPFICLPGEGVTVRSAAGDTSIRVNITLVWLEVPIT